MTAREKMEAEEKKQNIYIQRSGVCEVCGKLIKHSEAQLAHRIGQTKPNLKKYGKETLHHPANLALVCSLKCNSKVDISMNPMKVLDILGEIAEELL